jgi:hypothetical protein
MARAQRRRRKHRGTQGGTVRRSRARPRSRAEARGSAQRSRKDRLSTPPTWRGAIARGAIAAGALFLLLVLLLDAPVGGAIGLSLLAAALYTPSFHAIDTFAYRRRTRKRAAEKEQDTG